MGEPIDVVALIAGIRGLDPEVFERWLPDEAASYSCLFCDYWTPDDPPPETCPRCGSVDAGS